jgi:tetratricopeptide (TPR) repeat protein
MSRMIKAAATLVALVGVFQVGAGANGVPVPAASPSASPSRALTPEEMAVEAYNSGIGHRDRAVKADVQALKESKDSDRAKGQKKARDEYEKALKDFRKAADLNPQMPQAFNGMGYSYRKMGDYTKALENYDRALELNPKFLDAIEYRGEAYLALNRLDDAKQAYLALFAADRKQADSLMKAMGEFVAKKKVDPSGVDAAALAAFESWITERSGVAEQTRPMALNHPQSSWR